MDYKEKAKAYDKALEIAKNIYGASECKDILCTLETIFPELKKSVDERIRESLLEYLHTLPNHYAHSGVCVPEWLAWLEKRDEKKELKKIEQKPIQEIEPFEAEHGKYYYCIKDYFCGGRKQASKGDVVQALRGLPIMGLKDASEYFLPVNSVKCNSAWSEEDDSNLQCCIAKVQHDIDNGWIGRNGELLSWLESLKNRVQPKSTEWSEEDENVINHLLAICAGAKRYRQFAGCSQDDVTKYQTWLKSLRPQLKWSEEDERFIKRIHSLLYAINERDFEDIHAWLKSLKNRYTWKPSDEQMVALDRAQAELCSTEYNKPICDLIDALNKLKE